MHIFNFFTVMKRVLIIWGVLLTFGLFWACSKSDIIDVSEVSSIENETETPPENSSDKNGEDETSNGSNYFPLFDAETEYVSLDHLPEWLRSWISSNEEQLGHNKLFRELDNKNEENPKLFRGEMDGRVIFLIYNDYNSCMFCDTFYEDETRLDFENDQVRQSFSNAVPNMKRIYIKD